MIWEKVVCLFVENRREDDSGEHAFCDIEGAQMNIKIRLSRDLESHALTYVVDMNMLSRELGL